MPLFVLLLIVSRVPACPSAWSSVLSSLSTFQPPHLTSPHFSRHGMAWHGMDCDVTPIQHSRTAIHGVSVDYLHRPE
ncbi:hypothetical protein VTN02DRAFT_119 [Thermoascus thermophilus]